MVDKLYLKYSSSLQGVFALKKLTIVPFLFLLALVSFSCQSKDKLGSKENPIKLFFKTSIDPEIIAEYSEEFISLLNQQTGLSFVTAIPTSYNALIEDFGTSKADIGAMNSFGYLRAHDKFGAIARLRVVRHGVDYYQGQIVVRTDSGINEVKDLHGKRFAFTDQFSTSGYMFPLKMLREENVELSSEVFAMKHDKVIAMVYKGEVDGGASYYSAPDAEGNFRDARQSVKNEFPDVGEKVKIIATTKKIVNDPFVFRKDLPEEVIQKFISGLKYVIATPRGQVIFTKLYGVQGLVEATDSDYNELREMIKAINLSTEELMN